MPKLSMFNSISLDGYFTDAKNDMSWAHQAPDPEWDDFVKGNASGKGRLLFGRVTYQMMEVFWTGQGIQAMPEVAKGMTASPKVVFSRTLEKVSWENTVLLKGDLVEEVKKLKTDPGPDMVILGSGSIVAQLAQADLIDQYQIVISPVALGAGRTLFEGLKKSLRLKLVKKRVFKNESVFLVYQSF